MSREKVVITVADPIAGWEVWKGGVWKARAQWPFNQLFIDCRMMIEARWPNTGPDLLHSTLASAGKGTTPGSIVDPKLGQPAGAWDGALMHITPGAHWVSWTRKIKSYSPDKHEITFDEVSKEWAHVVQEGSRYYLTGKRDRRQRPRQ